MSRPPPSEVAVTGPPQPLAAEPSVPGPGAAGARPRAELRPSVATGLAVAVAYLGWKGAGRTGSTVGFVVAAAALAALALDLVWALVATRRFQADVSLHASSATAGGAVTGVLRARRPHHPMRCQLRSLDGAPLLVIEAPTSGELQGRARARGVVPALEFDVESRGLSGLIGCGRRHRVPLVPPLDVGPRPLPPDLPFPDLGAGPGEGGLRAAAEGDTVRSVRAYVAGDPLRRVHWPSTARRGDLVVKEVDDPVAPELVLVLDLGAGGDAGEAAAGRAAWYAGEALRRGYRVVLGTAEAGGAMAGRLSSWAAVDHRLARAVVGPPAVPSGASRATPVLTVTDRGDTWAGSATPLGSGRQSEALSGAEHRPEGGGPWP